MAGCSALDDVENQGHGFIDRVCDVVALLGGSRMGEDLLRATGAGNIVSAWMSSIEKAAERTRRARNR